jgi:hypothetical protein
MMKIPWWHTFLHSLMFNALIIIPAIALNLRYHVGVAMTHILLVGGAIAILESVLQPQLARISPLFLWGESLEKQVLTRKMIFRVGIVLILAGLYGVYALLTGIGAPYD